MTRTLAPSDISPTFEGEASVGGRVAFCDATCVELADALGAVRLGLETPLGTRPGDLLHCYVAGHGGKLRLRHVLEVRRAPELGGAGEFSRLQTQGRGRALAARSRALRTIRAFFEEEGFLETPTPTFVPSPGLDPHVHSLAPVRRGTRTDYLITSPEFHMKRLLTGGLPRIYQMARCFRAEELGALHEPEFTLLEWYRAFSQVEAMLADTEEIVARVFEEISSDMTYPGGVVTRPFARLSVREAFSTFAGIADGVGLARNDPAQYFDLLTSKVEDGLASLGRPVFLTHFPASMAALAQASPDDPSTAERFELYLGKTELCNGYGELTEEAEQRRRFEAEIARRKHSGEPEYPLDERLLSALHEGMPPSSGNALGVDRLIHLALGTEGIRDTLPFADDER